ncbi:MAG: hypothetical protein ACPG7F_01945 [Aggregatilineales bacterium]
MATETETTNETPEVNPNTLIGLSMIGGAGIVLMIMAAASGVVFPDIDSTGVGMAVVGGFGMLVAAIIAWFGMVQPHKNFDDISVAQYHGHAHDDHHDDAHDSDDAIISTEEAMHP